MRFGTRNMMSLRHFVGDKALEHHSAHHREQEDVNGEDHRVTQPEIIHKRRKKKSFSSNRYNSGRINTIAIGFSVTV